ncbi:MAG: tetratricopeptide repeat protein [Verrucomicrobiota bacterium]
MPDGSQSSPAPSFLPETTDEERHAQANQWTQRGIALLSAPVSRDLLEALGCFDEAIRLREHLPLETQPWYRWGLTAGWMNRADALSRLGRAEEALVAYDRALVHLQQLPLEMEPAFRWRLGLAWMNRALTLHDLGADHDEAALASLDAAIEALSHPALTTPRDQGTLGCAWMNRAALLMEKEPARPREALEAVMKALPCLAPLERTDLVAADAALKARHLSCQAIATLLETPPVPVDEADDWIMTATDQLEEALALADFWQSRADFSATTLQLFRFGCRIYLAFQPHFLGEFMLDVLRPRPDRVISEEFHMAAAEGLQHAAEILRQRGPTDLGMKRVDDLLLVLEKLDAAAQQIRAWRHTCTTAA